MAEATFQKSTLREYFESILVAVVLALFVRTFVFQAFKIPTGSMKPNLLVGDHLIVNKFIFAPTASPLEKALLPMRSIRRGDIIVFKFPEEPERDFIKRVIGLPGDTLELKNQTVLDQRAAAGRGVCPLPVSAVRGRAERRHPAQVRAGHGAGRPLFHDGRQPRRLAGQPVLGLPAAVVREGPRPVHLLVIRRSGRWIGRWVCAQVGQAIPPDPLSRKEQVQSGGLLADLAEDGPEMHEDHHQDRHYRWQC